MVAGNAFATNSSDAEQVSVNWYCDAESDGGKTKGQASWEFPDRCGYPSSLDLYFPISHDLFQVARSG